MEYFKLLSAKLHAGSFLHKEDIEPVSLDQICEDNGLVKGGWVSVKDRLPEKESDYTTPTDLGGLYYSMGCWVDSHGREFNPEYWYDLPPPPSEDAENHQKERKAYLTESENACFKIYMTIHISELNGLSKGVVEAWNIGQRIYDGNKRTSEDAEVKEDAYDKLIHEMLEKGIEMDITKYEYFAGNDLKYIKQEGDECFEDDAWLNTNHHYPKAPDAYYRRERKKEEKKGI